MTPTIIATAIMWLSIAALVAAVTLIGISISHVSSLLAQRRHAAIPVMTRSQLDTTER